ncbi:MAG: hypothetical protein ACK5KO_02625, partial [Arachnia sp.]
GLLSTGALAEGVPVQRLLTGIAGLVVILGLAVALGVAGGRGRAARIGRLQVGRYGMLTASWDVPGFHVGAERMDHWVLWDDIARVRRVRGFVVFEMRRGRGYVSPWGIALPADFVPAAAWQHLVALGVASR